jgi:hypothetical protein
MATRCRHVGDSGRRSPDSRIAPAVAAQDFRYGRGWELEMQPANRALPAVKGDVCLRDERFHGARLKLALTKGPGEEPTFFTVWLEVDVVGAGRFECEGCGSLRSVHDTGVVAASLRRACGTVSSGNWQCINATITFGSCRSS